MKKIKNSKKNFVIISIITSSAALIAIAALIAQNKVFSKLLSNIEQAMENEKTAEEPKIKDYEIIGRLRDKELQELMKVDIPDDGEDEEIL